MANLKRYTNFVDEFGKTIVLESNNGEWVKFDDIKELLNTSTNSAMTKCSCCEDDEDINTYRDNDYKFCPYCGAALRQ